MISVATDAPLLQEIKNSGHGNSLKHLKIHDQMPAVKTPGEVLVEGVGIGGGPPTLVLLGVQS